MNRRFARLLRFAGDKVLMASLAACVALPSLAAATEPLKIGFVNTERVLREAAPAQKAQKKLEKEFQPRDQELQKMDKQTKDLQAQLEKEAVTMPESERRKKERELGELTREFQRKQREFREDLNLRRNEELGTVLERANKVIRGIAEQEKYDLILQEAVFVGTRIDITDKVLKALSAEK
ncbi:MAG TPA: OmpH family outer membrane protein [Burkholderiales bacterium]|nr:OmpH family outer membrane protein [Burkholderiales bacterium]